MAERRILTLHVPQRPHVVDEVLTAIEGALLGAGAAHVWIDPSSGEDMTVMAELPVAADALEPGPHAVGLPAPRAAS
ncbi:hypothetical protein [Nocardioides panaciterrulae]|uniref:Uncharacterized protein n=1 Tax=Nocardioides panaciterrulae TaxID=661492 RepID=A0A7Y9E3M7_9ACTN|nr:hypothetical protein [Nocardioides panaciterrulae]NYD40514.1 hypothetical protein [Nocardioides panaciterrulae]